MTDPNRSSINEDFIIGCDQRWLPIRSMPTRMNISLIGMCTSGSCVIRSYMEERRVFPNDMLFMLPGNVVSCEQQSEDFSVMFLTVSQRLLHEMQCSSFNLAPRFFLFMRQHFHHPLNESEAARFRNYFEMLYAKSLDLKDADANYRNDVLINLTRVFYLDFYNFYKSNAQQIQGDQYSRKEELTCRFFLLIMDHYREHKEVAFYADKLCITPKYLTMLVKEVSGKSAKDWISEYVLLEVKALLKITSLDIQQIVSRVNFSDLSSMGRFFRQHTGMSPSQYRKQR